ncbi:MAG: DcaP family trimeric outer membrane transporter [Daejeonella sp.]
MKHFIISLLCILTLACQAVSAQPPQLKNDSTRLQLKLYGFLTLVASYDFQNLGKNDVFKPGDIPIPPHGTEPAFFMSAKQTRVGLTFTQKTSGSPIKGVLEADFHNTADQVNGLLRIRHAYLQWEGLTAGQTWSTFYDIEARPQTVDYQGPAGSTFSRAPLLRYDFVQNNHIWSIAAEDPAEEITIKENIQVKKQTIPDLVAAYKVYWSNQKSFFKLGILGRQLKYQKVNPSQVTTANQYGWGTMAIGKFSLSSGKGGLDNIKFELITGTGIAHYLLGTTGLGLDAAVNPDTHLLRDIKLSAGYLAYQHYWSDKLNSTVIAGALQADDQALLSNTATLRSSVYATANLFYMPVKPLSFGLEYQYGERRNINEQRGEANRIQGALIYNF